MTQVSRRRMVAAAAAFGALAPLSGPVALAATPADPNAGAMRETGLDVFRHAGAARLGDLWGAHGLIARDVAALAADR